MRSMRARSRKPGRVFAVDTAMGDLTFSGHKFRAIRRQHQQQGLQTNGPASRDHIPRACAAAKVTGKSRRCAAVLDKEGKLMQAMHVLDGLYAALRSRSIHAEDILPSLRRCGPGAPGRSSWYASNAWRYDGRHLRADPRRPAGAPRRPTLRRRPAPAPPAPAPAPARAGDRRAGRPLRDHGAGAGGAAGARAGERRAGQPLRAGAGAAGTAAGAAAASPVAVDDESGSGDSNVYWRHRPTWRRRPTRTPSPTRRPTRRPPPRPRPRRRRPSRRTRARSKRCRRKPRPQARGRREGAECRGPPSRAPQELRKDAVRTKNAENQIAQ